MTGYPVEDDTQDNSDFHQSDLFLNPGHILLMHHKRCSLTGVWRDEVYGGAGRRI